MPLKVEHISSTTRLGNDNHDLLFISGSCMYKYFWVILEWVTNLSSEYLALKIGL